ncbi:hypothetical protein AS034_12850 [[Bacillus] enclensis]|uniref:DUF4062 domain-containing protein n=1 Tax=[Bacillus] enclensis TaxID=1402860 RepID=A0A0V8HGQ8_9BACI|nr:DUF4062 domain-containing protein [[Bacillus] enclensis]KSU61724.1 hypothetical protein AS034_12850 [[Bacillus] enclensis]SCC14361.1 protein of unknown function [[Bacillus] enclensis]
MAEPAKVFISSAAEPGLKQLREQVHTELKMMEHYPLMYEKDFGPWPTQELVENCLEYVGKSDVFLLFVAHRAGNYMESYKATVTHCEFQAAHQNSKHIIVFVQDDIYRLFWYDLRIMMAEMVEEYKKNHQGTEPDTYKNIAEAAWNKHPEKTDSIDSYVWGFLFDIYKKGHYLEQIAIGVDPMKIIKRYFSDLFRKGSRYLALKDEIDEQISEGPTYRKHAEFTSKIIEYLKDGEILNPRMFLEYLQRFLKKGTIYTRPGTVFEEELGEYESCSGSTLYKKTSGQLQLVAASGMASDDNTIYSLNDPTSYVVKAYNSNNPELFYNEKKRQFYLGIKSGYYVICFHYPVDTFWTEENVQRFKEDIMRDIIETEPALFRNFVIKLLGGIK